MIFSMNHFTLVNFSLAVIFSNFLDGMKIEGP